jgi:hypothetical protein
MDFSKPRLPIGRAVVRDSTPSGLHRKQQSAGSPSEWVLRIYRLAHGTSLPPLDNLLCVNRRVLCAKPDIFPTNFVGTCTFAPFF